MNNLDQPYNPLLQDEKLPPLPPHLHDTANFLIHPPPRKLPSHPDDALSVPSPFSHDSGLVAPPTPTTPTTPLSPSFADSKPKKSNPLNDLIDTEKSYVDHLTGIIRKVAAAWSRSNLPPKELDTMFRSIEGVYKANRNLHMKLKDIGANPSSPKALGDLLMQWIDDLDAPYTAYCTKYCCGFDDWIPVQSNTRLSPILSDFSALHPPPATSDARTWTLDALFLLPKARLKYYKKLYNRLLKSTAPGRSDYRLLVGALDTLDRLLGCLESRAACKVGQNASEPLATSPGDEVVVDMRSQTNSPNMKLINARFSAETSPEGSLRGSSVSGGERSSRETASTSISRGSNATLSMPIVDLEQRLATQRTLDIFTMKPKIVKLQMLPPSLTFTREIRFSADVVIHFKPRATGVEVVHRHGHIFLLSDLFLICEQMTSEDQAQQQDGADMWLCYPPLAGKVLRVSEAEQQENTVQVAIMRKEYLFIQADSTESRNKMLAQFKECIEFSSSLPPPSKIPPPPVPSINGAIRSVPSSTMTGSTDALPPPQSPSHSNDASPSTSQLGLSSPPQQQASGGMLGQLLPPQPPPAYQSDNKRLSDELSKQQVSPLPTVPGIQEQQSQRGSPPGGPHNQPPASLQPLPSNSSAKGSGPIMPPLRNTSAGNSYGGPGYLPGAVQENQYASLSNPAIPQNHDTSRQFPFQQQQPFPPDNRPPPNPYGLPPRPPSEPLSAQPGIHKAPSTRSLVSQYDPSRGFPPVPVVPSGYLPNGNTLPQNSPHGSFGSLHAPQARPLLPSAQLDSRALSMAQPSFDAPSPPGSPVEETPQPVGPVTSTISAQMKCKIFLQQHHAQWKSLGSAKLKLYRQDPTNVKQLVVEAENKDKSILISTIVLTDGVERVGKTGVAIELSDKGARTGIIYMIQLRNEKSAGGLFDSLLAGSDRSVLRV